VRHIISALVENKPGVLAHIAGLFSARGYNIDSLAVSETEDARFSRATIVTGGEEAIIEQIRKQLERVVDVIKVQDFAGEDFVERDLMLIKVHAPQGRRGEIFELAEVFKCNVVDIGAKHMMLEVSGPENKLEALVALLKPYGIKEMARTGRVALRRGV
jgi:acetolactate synthase-1/3 small subunit